MREKKCESQRHCDGLVHSDVPRIKSKIQHDLTCLLKSDMNGFTYQIRAIITEIFVYELIRHGAKLNIYGTQSFYQEMFKMLSNLTVH